MLLHLLARLFTRRPEAAVFKICRRVVPRPRDVSWRRTCTCRAGQMVPLPILSRDGLCIYLGIFPPIIGCEEVCPWTARSDGEAPNLVAQLPRQEREGTERGRRGRRGLDLGHDQEGFCEGQVSETFWLESDLIAAIPSSARLSI